VVKQKEEIATSSDQYYDRTYFGSTLAITEATESPAATI